MAPRRAGIAKGQRTLIECTEPDGKMQDVHSMEAVMDEILASDDGCEANPAGDPCADAPAAEPEHAAEPAHSEPERVALPERAPEPQAKPVHAAGSGEVAPDAPLEKGSFVQEALPVRPRIVCYRCKTEADPVRCRLGGKSAGCWCCPKCNVKGTQLTRLFGTWPPACFAKLPQDHQEKFWKECQDECIGGGFSLEEKVVKTLLIRRIEVEESAVGGKYWPLSVYERKGFDTELIKNNCKDTQMHPQLGLCYLVKIKSVFSKTIEQAIRDELLEHKSSKQNAGKQNLLSPRNLRRTTLPAPAVRAAVRGAEAGPKGRGRTAGTRAKAGA